MLQRPTPVSLDWLGSAAVDLWSDDGVLRAWLVMISQSRHTLGHLKLHSPLWNQICVSCGLMEKIEHMLDLKGC
jgi:hypothetical protein